jgi:hypothetical protein
MMARNQRRKARMRTLRHTSHELRVAQLGERQSFCRVELLCHRICYDVHTENPSPVML